MRYVLAGSSGFLGTALTKDLKADGHEVVRLVRREPFAPDEVRWDPYRGQLDQAVIDDADIVVNLAGANIGRPWIPPYRNVIRESRVRTTAMLARAIARAGEKAVKAPALIVQGGTGAYGRDRDGEVLTEDSPTGTGFLAEVCALWEGAADPARKVGARVANLRSGVVLDARAPAFRLLALPFRLGIGGRFGSGRQYFPIITLHDWLRAVRFVADQNKLSGPINVALPNTPTNAELAKALAEALHRPALVPVPAFAMKLVLGDFAWELVGSKHALPTRLLDAGFTFDHPTVEEAVAFALS